MAPRRGDLPLPVFTKRKPASRASAFGKLERNYVAHDTDREQRQDLARTHDLGEGAVTHQGDVHAPVKPERPDQLFV